MEVTDFVEELLSLEGKVLIEETKITEEDVDYRKLKVTGGKILCMVLVIMNYLKSYLLAFITGIWQ